MSDSAQPTEITETPPSPSPTPSEKKDGAAPAAFKPTWPFYLCFITLCVMTLAVALDATSLSVALPIISQKLRGSAIEAFWSGTSFLIASTVLQPSFASFSHIFGRKPMTLVALAFFTLGAILAGVANGFTLMLVGRSIQGIGGGGLIALTEIIVTDLVPLRERGKWFGLISSCWAVGSVTGPLLGGGFAQDVSWRWIFYINLPLCGVAFIFIPLFLRLNYQTSAFGAKLKRVDWVGSVLFVGSTMSFLIPITWGGVMYSWDNARTLAPLLIGVAGLVAFVFYEKLVAQEPLIPLEIFQNRSAIVSYLGTFIHGMILWSLLYYGPLYYEACKGFSPIKAGVALLPETLTVAPASVLVGVVVSITGRYRWGLWLGWIFTTVGMGVLTLQDPDTPTVEWVWLNLIAGLGTGVLFPSMAFAVQASSTDKNMAWAVSMFSFFRAFGQSVGVAVGGVVFQNQIRRRLLEFPALASRASEYSKDAASLVQIMKLLPPDEARDVAIAYADALKIVWAVMCAFGGVALFASLLTEGLSLDRELVTEQGYKHSTPIADEEKT
ncbi:MAG: hypothetical protein M1823_004854 [Watsoniomyces obsoletus]|nr:MAG: hypothetical protein M1823_004854 [Watsoniomyces obsoletus]